MTIHDTLNVIRKALNNIEQLKLQQSRASFNLQNVQLVIPTVEIISQLRQLGDLIAEPLQQSPPYQFIPNVQHQYPLNVGNCRLRFASAAEVSRSLLHFFWTTVLNCARISIIYYCMNCLSSVTQKTERTQHI